MSESNGNGHRSGGFVALRSPVASITKSRAQELSMRAAAARTVTTSEEVVDSSPRAPTSAFQDWTISQSVFGLKDQHVRLPYRMPFEILEIVELLAQYNPDYSQAVENIKTLANPGHDLIVEGRTREVQRVKDDLESMASRVGSVQGIDGVIDALLKQGAVYGAMAGEWVVDADYTHVVDFMEVNPKNIRYFYLKDEARFVPFQRVNLWQAQIAEDRGQQVIFDCVRLNENTFMYAPFDSASGSPYGIPPFLAALSNISIQRDMVTNMAQIVKKLGLLGMVDLSVEQLSPRAGENEAEYQVRAGKYLDDYVTVLKQTMRDGGMVHYDDVTTSTVNVTGNAAGATNIFKQNEELVFSGLKSMPSVQGRSYSTTETYAGVAYDIILRNTVKFQRAAKRYVENGYWLQTTLQGEAPSKIALQFRSNKSLHRLQDAQAEQAEIVNSLLLWVCGINNQQDMAQRHGKSQPAIPIEEPDFIPRILTAIGGPQIQGDGADGGQDGSGVNPPEESVGTNA